MKKAFFPLCVLLLIPFFAFSASETECLIPGRMPKKMSLKKLEKLAEKDNCQPLLNAIQATKNLYKNNEKPGIKEWDFLKAAYFIESYFPVIGEEEKQFLTKNQTDLKQIIEYDPYTQKTFIVLRGKKAFIGKGKKKKVFKSILYQKEPKVVARGEQSAPMEAELKAHHALLGRDGLMKAHAFTTHMDGRRDYTTIYSDLYHGTLREFFEKNHKLGLRNKLTIMLDVLQGLESIHSNNYVHRDLHANNYLLTVETDPDGKKTVHAVIADLGRTIEVSKAKNVPAQGAGRLIPPEEFEKKKLKQTDYFATDIYALGCIFYRLYHNRLPRWQEHYIKSRDLSRREKKKIFFRTLRKETVKKREFFSQKSQMGTLSVKEDLDWLILKMVHEKPEQRGTAASCRQEVERILNRYKLESEHSSSRSNFEKL